MTASGVAGNIAGIIWGLPESLVSNVMLDGVNISPTTKTFCIYDARGIQFIDSNLTAPNSSTNTLTLYNAQVTVTNSAANANLVTLGGLAIPPTNNTLAFFNAQTAITDTNELGDGPIILGGSTLTFNQSSVAFSNNITAASASAFALGGGTNLYGGAFSGPLALNQSTGALLLYGSDAVPAGGAPSLIANLTIGNCGQAIAGSILLSGGTLFVTNGTQSGVLDVRDGTVTLNNGSLTADRLMMDNTCGSGGTAAVWMTGGHLTVTNNSIIVGSSGAGQLTVSNGAWLARDVTVGYGTFSAQGTLVVAGGTNLFSSTLSVGSGVSGVGIAGTGAVWITGGRLITTNDVTYAGYGYQGAGQITVSNGTWMAEGVELGYPPDSGGTLTIAGGTVTLQVSGLVLGVSGGGGDTGTVWMTGGELNMLSGSAIIGNFGTGRMTISNGTWLSYSTIVDQACNGGNGGTLTIAGGSSTFVNGLDISQMASTTGTVWMTGGQLLTSSTSGLGGAGVGRMILSNGTWESLWTSVGQFAGAQGTLTILGGTNTVDGWLHIGTSDCKATGTVTVAGGSLFVTNDSANAVLDVENGTFTLSSGTVIVNTFVMTNSCARFVRTGGTLIYGNAILNPNADTDGDGIPNGYELAHGLDPLNPADATADNDGDGFSNLQEYLAGTDPDDPG